MRASPGNRLTAERDREVCALNVLRRHYAGELADGRYPGGSAEDGVAVHAVRRGVTFPANDEGLADSAFIKASFEATERPGRRGVTVVRDERDEAGFGSVVARKNHDCIFAEAQFVEAVEDAAHLLVDIAQDGVPDLERSVVFAPARREILVFRQHLVGRMERRVRIVQPSVDVERLVLVLFDEVDRGVGDLCTRSDASAGPGATVLVKVDAVLLRRRRARASTQVCCEDTPTLARRR